ncbi:unnamed protein product [Orchesella dallaii]|uniref:Uncharacterized protein n=1 Tax=Orchesella dallaii TaxID=48710 RepID=A0ABP1PVK2_9HEXA
MGQITSKAEPYSSLQEAFMIRYLSTQGPSPYSMDLIPDGISSNEITGKHKIRTALKRQRQLSKAMRSVDCKLGPRCLSPCLLENFEITEPQTGQGKNVYNYSWHDKSQSSPRTDDDTNARTTTPLTQEQIESLGGLGRLVRPANGWQDSEGIVTVDVNRNLIEKKRIMRSRSRPAERSARSVSGTERQAKSVALINDELCPIREVSSAETIENIQLPVPVKPKIIIWPSPEVVNKILNDPRSRPTSLFLARFRRNPQEPYVEVDYRYSRLTGDDTFKIKGNLKDLLEPAAQLVYEADIANNNGSEKMVFLDNAPYIFNNLEGKMYWNGFLTKIEGNPKDRLRLKSLDLDSSTLIFDLTGFTGVKSKKKGSQHTFNCFSEHDDNASKVFCLVRGKALPENTRLYVDHPKYSADMNLTLPTLPESGIPFPITKKEVKD